MTKNSFKINFIFLSLNFSKTPPLIKSFKKIGYSYFLSIFLPSMNITRSNFNQALPLIFDCIKRSDYLAFDFEFTGVKASELLINSALEPVNATKKTHN